MSHPSSHPVIQSVRKRMSEMQINPHSRIAVGVSGGLDSMVLLQVLHHLGYAVTALHVNFQLRGYDSDADAELVEEWCRKREIPFLLQVTDTNSIAVSTGLNTQLAARHIRYTWWNDLLHQGTFQHIATAHHLDDAIETVLMNVCRGTGLKGLVGIPAIRGGYLRPLLSVSRSEIEAYAHDCLIPYRTDLTNLEDQYDRNRIRHQIIPPLQDIYPGFYERFRHTLQRAALEWSTVDHLYRQWASTHVTKESDGERIVHDPGQLAFTLRWLEDKGIPWNLAEQFVTADDPVKGNVLTYDAYRVSRTSDGFFLSPLEPPVQLVIPTTGCYAVGDMELCIEKWAGIPAFSTDTPDEVFVTGDVIQWPLVVRHLRPGDRFQPLGMQGHSKKLQDYTTDLKLDPHEKAGILILSNPEHILWVMGYRLDERAKITDDSRDVYKLTYSKPTTG